MNKCECQQYRDMLEDVVNELDLSDHMLDKHGPWGTPVAQLVKEVLEAKDMEIAALQRGFKVIKG